MTHPLPQSHEILALTVDTAIYNRLVQCQQTMSCPGIHPAGVWRLQGVKPFVWAVAQQELNEERI